MNADRHDRTLPQPRWRSLLQPAVRLMHAEAAPGVLLAVATVIALGMANSPLAAGWAALWDTRLSLAVGGLRMDYPLWYWVNDALMAVFFFLIGLEIKRELVAGELSDPRAVVLPVAGAIGGAMLPALIYLLLHASGPEGGRGWAVPMATDIAFVVGCMALLGRRVPGGLKVFLLTLAIVDDIIAVAVIALFYTADIAPFMLLAAVAGFGVVLLLRWLGVRSLAVYAVVGAVIWLLTFKGGVHPTIAAVILGLLTPARSLITDGQAREHLRQAVDGNPAALAGAGAVVRESVSPLDRLTLMLHPWVMLGIMPLFALANAGVAVKPETLGHPVSVAVALGLLIGKPIGITGASLLVVRAGVARLPGGTNWAGMIGAAALGGIGFTMSMFIANLGMEGPLLSAAKSGIILGSAASGLLGMVVLLAVLRKRPQPV